MTDDLRERLRRALRTPQDGTQLDRVEAVARAHASERIESFVAGADYCPYCGHHADYPHEKDCPLQAAQEG